MLMVKWKGPYYIKAKLTPVTYEIDIIDRKNNTSVSSMSEMEYSYNGVFGRLGDGRRRRNPVVGGD